MGTKEPTADQVHRTLEVEQIVWLAYGYSELYEVIRVCNYKTARIPEYPEFGEWRSFEDIKKALADKIARGYPKRAFPCMHPGKITLYARNEADRAYMVPIGSFGEEE